MPTLDPRVDAYIAKSPAFAQPILAHIRATVHAACPEVVETMKWSMPHFDHHGIMCSMAAFKGHCALGFWKAALIEGLGPNSANGGAAAGNFGRITAVSDLPSPRALAGFVKAAMRLNEQGTTAPRAARGPKPAPETPADLDAALSASAGARANFDAFTASQRREYIEWIVEAKREETRAKRVAQAVEWIADGKTRNWKYQ